MLDLVIPSRGRRALRIACFGAHCDDIEIGCGGTLLELQARYPRLSIDWIVLSGTPERRRECQRGMNAFVRPRSRGQLLRGDFADGAFPAHYAGLKDYFRKLGRELEPDLIFCHERTDLHQDHRTVNELVWTTFRDHLILEYEIPKWDGGLGTPNVYVPLSAARARRKTDAILRIYSSQSGRDWFDARTFDAMLRLRQSSAGLRADWRRVFMEGRSIFSGH